MYELWLNCGVARGIINRIEGGDKRNISTNNNSQPALPYPAALPVERKVGKQRR